MNYETRLLRRMCCICLGVVVSLSVVVIAADDIPIPTEKETQLKFEEKKSQDQRSKSEVAGVSEADLEKVISNLPRDTSPKLTAKRIAISGNAVMSTEELLIDVPSVYSSSNQPLLQADSDSLYDFRVLQDLLAQPGQPREISARTIRGFTQYILSVYQANDYAGIYVYVPNEVLTENKLRDEILVVNVIEASVASVSTKYFTPDGEQAEKGYLNESALRKWLSVKEGDVANQRKLEETVNLLNLNPDRYISPVVSKGPDQKTLALNYNIYEANPWHYFLQVDNSGTDDRQWSPRIGLINTNLLGFDDKLTVFHQSRWDSGFDDQYSLYGSYDFPIMGPKLRLDLFGGYSKFNVNGGGGIDFLGDGKLYGGRLRYNVFQKNGWFYDLTTTLSREESKVSSSIFSAILGSKVKMDLWGIGVNVHRRNDMANTNLAYDYVMRIGGSGQDKYWNGLTGARTNAEKDFAIHTITANHSQYLKADKIQRITGSLRWIIPEDRLVPAKMTTFGGMYSVRGYRESRIIADGGILASVQYEYDLVKRDAAQGQAAQTLGDYELRKLAPLAFFDYGRAKMEDKVAGETGSESLYSIGVGALVELGEHFSGALYYGYPLESTDTTDTGDGRINLSLMMRW